MRNAAASTSSSPSGAGTMLGSDRDGDVGEASPWLDAHADDARSDEMGERGCRFTNDAHTFLTGDVRVRDRNRVCAAGHRDVGQGERRRARMSRIANSGVTGYGASASGTQPPMLMPIAIEIGGHRLVDVLEDEHVCRLADAVDSPRPHQDHTGDVDVIGLSLSPSAVASGCLTGRPPGEPRERRWDVQRGIEDRFVGGISS